MTQILKYSETGWYLEMILIKYIVKNSDSLAIFRLQYIKSSINIVSYIF